MSSPLARALIDELQPEDLAELAHRLLPYLSAGNEWLDTRAAARYAGCTVAALHCAMSRDQVRYEQRTPGGRARVRRADLDAWRAGRHTVEGPLPAATDHGRPMVRGDDLHVHIEQHDETPTHTLYVLAGGDRVKIGITKDFPSRLRALRSASPVELEVVRLVYTNDPFKVEAALHAEFAGHRAHGEWFAADVLPRIADMSDREIAERGQ